LKNATSQGLSGQDTKNGKINTGIQLPDGSNLTMDPYSPADEPVKMLRDGALPFLFGKINPLLKEGINQATNHAYYPGAMFAPSGNAGMAASTIRTNGAPNGYNAGATINHMLRNLIPFGGGPLPQLVNQLASVPPKTNVQPSPTLGQDTLRGLLGLLGAFTSKDNPAMDQYYSAKDQQTQAQNTYKYDLSHGIPIPPTLKKEAYGKIPFPVGR
jgi:hypothetical protein